MYWGSGGEKMNGLRDSMSELNLDSIAMLKMMTIQLSKTISDDFCQ